MAELARVAKPGAPVVVFEPDFETSVVAASDRVLTRKLLNFFCDSYRNGHANSNRHRYADRDRDSYAHCYPQRHSSPGGEPVDPCPGSNWR